MKGVAAQQAPQGKVETFERSVLFNRFLSIFRTAWKKATAISHIGADHDSVAVKKKNDYLFHSFQYSDLKFF
jgi:hypothetical protein